MKTKNKIPHLILAGLFGVSTAHAATIISIDDTSGARLYDQQQDGSGSNVNLFQALNVGTKSNGAGYDMHAGFVFQMTGAADGYLEAADFSVSATGGQGQSIYNIDLYANRVSSSSTFNVSDYQVFDSLIMEDFWVVNDGLGNFSLDATGQSNLLSYLQTNWVEDDYVFFTLKLDTAPSFIAGADANQNTIFGFPGDNDSLLTVAVPEPSSTALLGLGGLALMLRRKRS
jgi:hypothetical protein